MTDLAMEAAAQVWCFYGMADPGDQQLVMEKETGCDCQSPADCWDWRVDLPIVKAAITAYLAEPDEERMERVAKAMRADDVKRRYGEVPDGHHTMSDANLSVWRSIFRAALSAMSADGG